jgi:HEAT repeat protein
VADARPRRARARGRRRHGPLVRRLPRPLRLRRRGAPPRPRDRHARPGARVAIGEAQDRGDRGRRVRRARGARDRGHRADGRRGRPGRRRRRHRRAPQVAGDLLGSEDPEARRIAVEGIGKKAGKIALGDLRKAAEDPDPRVRRAAIRWLGQLKDKESAGTLERDLRHADEGVRAAAALALARIGAGAGDLAALAKQALADRELAVRLAGIELLRAGKHTAELTALTDDADPLVALEAAIAVADPALARKSLDRAAASDRWTTRAGAANTAVRAVDRTTAAAVARRLAADPELSVRLAAARTLASTGDTAAAIELFAAALATDSALSAATDLARLGDDRGVKLLESAVRDAAAGPDRRASAASAHVTARRITPGLVAALADPSAVVRVEAAAALVALAR